MKKSNHRHSYVRHLRRMDGFSGDRYDIVNVCSICGRIKDLPFKQRLVKVNGGYLWPTRLEDICKHFGEIPLLPDDKNS